MWDVRVLTLYKQHYMDFYNRKLYCDYSCWGYYDGMDVTEVELTEKSSFLMKGKPVPISELWYKTGEKIGGMTGQYGSINIGLFRYATGIAEHETKKFWQEKEKMPFWGISFLQLDNPKKYGIIRSKIESKSFPCVKEICNCVAYCTYDNADLVLLFSSNSLTAMEGRLQQIDDMPEIRYQHSVLGVSERYLSDCLAKGKILECWKGIKCFINEPVCRLDIRFVSSGEAQIANIEKKILDEVDAVYKIKNYETATYAYVAGHENLVFSLADTDVRTMLIFLLRGGFTTHQNVSYTKRVDAEQKLQPRLFNIETSYILKSEEIQNLGEPEEKKDCLPVEVSHNWFQDKIGEYKLKLKEALEDADESLYSYYLALLRTLNVLVQYERFSLSEDIFYLLYPSFKVFDEKLRRAFEEARAGKKEDYAPKVSVIKQSMSEFLEAVNSVIYHTIHTDQVYLMVPGYSGTSFSIPIKLNMVFLWFTDCVARLFGNGRKYQCILIPTMEATPATKSMKFEGKPEILLICVKISQRTLYMPRSFMIILAHEMGHYIGGDLRCRETRAYKMAKFASICLADTLFGESKNNIEDRLKEEFQRTAQDKLECHMKENSADYHGDEVVEVLKGACRKLLSQWRIINSDNLIKVYQEFDEKEQRRFHHIKEVLDAADTKATVALIEDNVIKEIEREFKIYREVFSDLIAIKLLRCDRSAFEEAYLISAGMDVIGEEIQKRVKLMEALGSKIGWDDNGNEQSDMDRPLYDYLLECNEKLDKKLAAIGKEGNALWGEVRDLYQAFSEEDTQGSCFSGDRAYDVVLKCICKIKEDIDKEI